MIGKLMSPEFTRATRTEVRVAAAPTTFPGELTYVTVKTKTPHAPSHGFFIIKGYFLNVVRN